ncbi:unnamed protein product [Didymodactylos carnosus]|uniref:Uncharacterized protein n=2 Tax=Didymodactylos carnosus TaxID=1234261 RepID=A0A8S2HZY0_9BILA|nr:unnamed protein product [Didymodactylos carnosus]CAF3701633.1 unnamed protein product [Didymodactylos carnosus]
MSSLLSATEPHHNHYHYSQSLTPATKTKYLSKSSESLSNEQAKEIGGGEISIFSTNKALHPKSMKKSQTALTGFDQPKANTTVKHPSTSNPQNTGGLRRRFSLFRTKRYQQQQQAKPSSEHELLLTTAAPIELNLNDNIRLLQDEVKQRNTIIENLRQELNVKTQELELTKQRLFELNNSYDIEQALQIQTKMNTRLEEMLTENETLKKSIHDLECLAQQQQSDTSNNALFFQIWNSRSRSLPMARYSAARQAAILNKVAAGLS